MTRYDFIAKFYDFLLKKVEKSVILPIRENYVPQIEGKTLDIAVGTGNNIEFYPKNSEVILVDRSKKMLDVARKKSLSRDDLNLEFVRSSLESLPFDDCFFDTILSIDVFCSVKEPYKVARELYRVLKPNGKAIFAEHGKTSSKMKNLLLYFTNLLTYPTVGSSMTRTPEKYILSSGFNVVRKESLSGTFVYMLAKK